MSLMEMFVNPSTIHSLTMGEKLVGGLITTLMGIGMTFCILLIVWVCISVVSRIISGPKKKPVVEAAPAAAPVKAEVVENVDDSQLIAVIMAAIAAAEGEQVFSNLTVKRISRISGSAPTWSNTGRQECLDSRRV